MRSNGTGLPKAGEVLYWHWSPNNGWAMNFPLRGFNECLITYVLAASATRYPVHASTYTTAAGRKAIFLKMAKHIMDTNCRLGFDYGGPLFFSQYSFWD